MMNDKILKMLDLAYELEGLLSIAAEREALRPRLLELAGDKIHALLRLRDEAMASPENIESTEPAPVEEDVPQEREELPGDEEDVPQEREELPGDEEDAPHEREELSGDEEDVLPAPQPRNVRKGAPVFSVNDRFLFTRELFGGNLAEFERTLKDVACCESSEEAEEFLVGECGLDPESPVVADFMAIVAKYFRQE